MKSLTRNRRAAADSRAVQARDLAATLKSAFVRIYAIKNGKKPDAKLVLPFRGAATE